MATASSFLPELDDIVKHGSAEKRAVAISRISSLFLQGADRFETRHVALFDDILIRLIASSAVETRADLAERLAPLGNAPPAVVNKLALDDEIRIAGPILARSPIIDEPTLIGIARMKGPSHLTAICERKTLSPLVTDVILRRGDRDVVRTVARNAGAQFSETGYSGLVKRAADDGVLAIAVGQREDISPRALKELLSKSVDIVRRRLFDIAKPKQRAAINMAMVEISSAPNAQLVKRDFTPAQRAILALHRKDDLNEAAILGFAKSHQYEEAVAALSAMTGLRIGAVDRLIAGERLDPILILGRAAGLEWATVRALIVLRLGPGKVPSPTDIEEARVNFERLSPITAQRVQAFWRAREDANPA